jgi:hypothetical protein
MLRSTSDIRISTSRGTLRLWLAAASIRDRPHRAHAAARMRSGFRSIASVSRSHIAAERPLNTACCGTAACRFRRFVHKSPIRDGGGLPRPVAAP